MPVPPTEWIIPFMIPTEGLVVISGKPGSFKTFFALWMCLRASAGLPIFENMEETFFPKLGNDAEPKSFPSLFIEEENTLQTIKERVQGFKTSDPSAFFLIDGGFKFTDEDAREEARRYITEQRIRLLVLDPFSSVMGLQNENDNAEVSKIMDIIRKEFVSLHVAVVLIHHPSKADGEGRGIRGAGDILGKCDVHLSLDAEDDREKIIRVSYEKLRIADKSMVANFRMKLIGSTDARNAEFVYLEEAKTKTREKKDELKTFIMDCIADGKEYQRKEVADSVGHNSNDKLFDDAWRELLAEKHIVQNATTKKYHNGEPKVEPF